MNELDRMKEDKDKILRYWKNRLLIEEAKKHSAISITKATLRWFLWMIEDGE